MDQDINQLDIMIEALAKSTTLALVVPPSASPDIISAASALSQSLRASGKSVAVVSSTSLKRAGSEPIGTELSAGGNDLCVSFPYVDGSIDKVDYKIENGMFNLIVIPRAGFPRVTKEELSFSYAGGQPDCIITFDVKTLTDLGDIYTKNQAIFDSVPVIINIDRHSDNSLFGNVNYIQPANSLMTQIVYGIMGAAQLPVDPEIATQLYSGIVMSTDNFTEHTTPEIFETVAALVRAGAIRKMTPPPAPVNRQTPPRPTSNQQARPGQQQPSGARPNQNQNQRPAHSPQGQNPNRPPTQQVSKPKPPQQASKSRVESGPGDHSNINKPKTWIDNVEASPSADVPRDLEGTQEKSSGFQDGQMSNFEGNDTSDQAPQTPVDWLKPKIMKGNGLI
jgi:hypothetical protein